MRSVLIRITLFIIFYHHVPATGSKLVAQVTILNTDSTTLYSYNWYLFEMGNADALKMRNYSATPDIYFYPGMPGTFTATADCTDVEGRITVSGDNQIKFTDLVLDDGECDHHLSDKFFEMLKKVDQYKIVNHQLRLYGRSGKILAKFYAEISHLSHYQNDALEGQWHVNMLGIEPSGWVQLEDLDSLPHITIYPLSSGKVEGYTGCNKFSAELTIDKNLIRVTRINSANQTQCASDIEHHFLTALSNTTSFWVGDELLSFWKGNSLVMQFKRVNPIRLTEGEAVRFKHNRFKNVVYTCTVGS